MGYIHKVHKQALIRIQSMKLFPCKIIQYHCKQADDTAVLSILACLYLHCNNYMQHAISIQYINASIFIIINFILQPRRQSDVSVDSVSVLLIYTFSWISQWVTLLGGSVGMRMR